MLVLSVLGICCWFGGRKMLSLVLELVLLVVVGAGSGAMLGV